VKPYYQDKWVTIYHGDCREILPQLEPVDLVLTDPPYGVGRKYGKGYDDSPTRYWEWFKPVVSHLRQIVPVVAMTHRLEAIRQIPDWDWIICWRKPFGAGARIGNSPILPHWEPVLLWGIHSLGTKRRALPDVISCNPEKSNNKVSLKSKGKITFPHREKACQFDENTNHPLPKPTALFCELIVGLSFENQTILDPFLESGTTCYCAKKLNRYSIGIEIEEKYCEIAAKRCSQEVMELNL